ncbi:PLP-dependent aminotransferase family protein [Agarilytica rhodophyticola]|uniref:MocR-like pyridoxine biosynthesis transcription factor PdxR n=1 Tax=Agarilytica rhodophyticola TaxID=1737490 RepID=UPI000B348BA4|nr:PLP-dependent aminotransferase family protein [Agarilytica rhodophyticola]
MQQPWEIQLWLEDSEGTSFHAKLANQLTKDIQSGRLKPGMSMPGSRSMAKQLGVNRKTIQLVYEELESQGWFYTRPRQGTFVADILPEPALSDRDRKLIDIAEDTLTPSDLATELYKSSLAQHNDVVSTNDGVPDPRLIPYEQLSKAYRRAIIHSTRTGELSYGDPRGVMALRCSIRDMLTLDRFMNVSVDQICTVRGSQMGIYLASRVLDPKKGVIVCEELSYPPAVAAFENNGFQVLRCQLDGDGLNTDHLKSIIANNRVAAVYTTPHHQYPTTVSMSMERRLMLLALSCQHKIWIIEDDYDHEFHYGTKPIPPLSSLPNSDHVVHIGSMSKVFAPALRLGYVAADKRFIDLLAQEILLIDRQGNTITELAVSHLMARGEVKKHIRKVRKLYQARRDFALQEFFRIFGKEIIIEKPAGGMALWVNLSRIMCENKIAQFNHPNFHFKYLFSENKSEFSHIRFGFGALSEEEISDSIMQLARACSYK